MLAIWYLTSLAISQLDSAYPKNASLNQHQGVYLHWCWSYEQTWPPGGNITKRFRIPQNPFIDDAAAFAAAEVVLCICCSIGGEALDLGLGRFFTKMTQFVHKSI